MPGPKHLTRSSPGHSLAGFHEFAEVAEKRKAARQYCLNIPQGLGVAVRSAFDQRWNRCRSWTGTPSISAMIVVGKGRA